jgi:hypothetical protein
MTSHKNKKIKRQKVKRCRISHKRSQKAAINKMDRAISWQEETSKGFTVETIPSWG